MKSLEKGQKISKTPRGCWQAYCAAIFIRSPTPEPTSSPTLCSAWEKWEMILLRPGRAKLNGILKTITTRKRIESTGCQRSSMWQNSQESQRWASLRRIQKLLTDLQCEPEHLKDRIIFMSVFNDFVWDAKGNEARCEHNSPGSCGICSQVPSRSLVFLGPGSEEKWYGTYTYKQMDPGIEGQNKCWQISLGPGHPTFRASSGFARGELRSRVGERSQYTSMVALNRSSCFLAQWFLRISSASTEQLQTYATKYPKGIGALEKPAAPKHLEKVEIPTILSKVEELTARVRSRNCGQATSPFYEIPKYVSKNFITEASPATHAIDRFVLLRVLHFSFLFRFLLAYAAGFPVALHSYFRFFLVLDFQCICFRQIRNPVMKMMKK